MNRVFFVVLYLLLAAGLAAVAYNYYLIDQLARPVPLLDGALAWPSQTAGAVLGAAVLAVLAMIAVCHVRAAYQSVAPQAGDAAAIDAETNVPVRRAKVDKPAQPAAPASEDTARRRERAADIGQAAARVAAQFAEIRARALQLSEAQAYQAREIATLAGLKDQAKLAQRLQNLSTATEQTAAEAGQVEKSIAEIAGQVRQLRDWATDLTRV